MRRLAAHARVFALLALALFASTEPLLAQDGAAESSGIAPSAGTPRERVRQRIERARAERGVILREAPPGFERWARELPPVQRRRLDRRLRTMPETQRERFFRDWGRMSLREREELADRIVAPAEVRRRRELPARLRTPEMRERFAKMSPEERRDFFTRARAWRELDAGERHRMRARLGKFGELSPDAQRALVEQKFARRSPEERARILAQLREASQQMRALRETRGAAGSSSDAAAVPPSAPPKDRAPPEPPAGD